MRRISGSDPYFELHDVLANDEHAAALVTIRGERAGKQQLNENEVLIYHFRDGKVSEVWIQSTDQYARTSSSRNRPACSVTPIVQSCITTDGWGSGGRIGPGPDGQLSCRAAVSVARDRPRCPLARASSDAMGTALPAEFAGPVRALLSQSRVE